MQTSQCVVRPQDIFATVYDHCLDSQIFIKINTGYTIDYVEAGISTGECVGIFCEMCPTNQRHLQ